MTVISSRDHTLVKDFIRLRTNRNYRYKSRRFAVEGTRLVTDAIRSGTRIENAFITSETMQKHKEVADALYRSGAGIYEISDPVAGKMADTQNPQGLFCTAFMLDKVLMFDKINIYGAYIALENLQDPGNMGTVLRTAEALGIDGILMSADCVDIYSPKVVRAGMGAVFRIPFCTVDLPETLLALNEKGMLTMAAVPDGNARDITGLDTNGGSVIVIGNEGTGITQECADLCSMKVTIPMKGRAESLNAAAAASILMWEMMKKRPQQRK